MQVNSAQDYLTAQKRRVIATLSAVTPQPAHRRYNYVYLSTVANGESKYEKTPYPQNLSLAAGSKPGLAYVTQGVRPTVDLCCIPPVVVEPPALYAFTTFTFSPGGRTGREGPYLSTLTSYSTYAATSWAGNTAFLNMDQNYQGIQIWTVPKSGSYLVTCAGASTSVLTANTRGLGQIIQTTLTLTQGQKLLLLVGQSGQRVGGNTTSCSGSGGSFVALPGSTTGTLVSAATCLVAAGGGGGNNPPIGTVTVISDATTADAGKTGNSASTGGGGIAGANGTSTGAGGGTGGGGGGSASSYGGGGGGFIGNGAGGSVIGYTYGYSFRNGGLGGQAYGGQEGGFGGGGGDGNAGGGGWSGGGASDQTSGGGGGSYPPSATDMGKNTSVLTGYITITTL